MGAGLPLSSLPRAYMKAICDVSISIAGDIAAENDSDPVSGAAGFGRQAVAAGPAPGLVICATTPRDLDTPVDWGARFPTSDMLAVAKSLFAVTAAWDGSEGPRAQLMISPGALAVERHDYARRERYEEREHARRAARTAQIAAKLAAGEDLADVIGLGREVGAWSRRSRARMTRRLCELDYSGWLVAGAVPAMVTLTYPGDWLTVAPTGKAVKRHSEAFKTRYWRAWGVRIVGVWKLEFQRRGAPHLHILMVPPRGKAKGPKGGELLNFKQWLSATWADVVAHPDPVERMKHEAAGTGLDFSKGLRATDPRRVAVYFTKHGTFADKAYQNIVPDEWRGPGAGPGRFWGYWGLVVAVEAVELPALVAVAAVRVLRRWARSQGTTRAVRAVRGKQSRVQRRRVARMTAGAGWVSVNDGASMASQLARYLDLVGTPAVLHEPCEWSARPARAPGADGFRMGLGDGCKCPRCAGDRRNKV